MKKIKKSNPRLRPEERPKPIPSPKRFRNWKKDYNRREENKRCYDW